MVREAEIVRTRELSWFRVPASERLQSRRESWWAGPSGSGGAHGQQRAPRLGQRLRVPRVGGPFQMWGGPFRAAIEWHRSTAQSNTAPIQRTDTNEHHNRVLL